jgi:hypothetical protein
MFLFKSEVLKQRKDSEESDFFKFIYRFPEFEIAFHKERN